MMNEAAASTATVLPGAGTSQPSGAAQAAAELSAAQQPAADRLYAGEAAAAAQQQASGENGTAAAESSRPKGAPLEGRGEQGSGEHAGARLDAPAATAAPEQYEFRPVEGVNLSGDVIGKFSEVARELNLSQDAAQKMLDQVAPVIARQQHAAIQQLNEQWVSAVQADKEIGGEKLGANLAIARKARDAFGTDGLRKLLNESRIGNHPEVIRFFVRAGQAISEDTFVSGGTRPATGGKDAATVLYGKPN